MSSTDTMLAELRSPDGPRRAVIRTLPGAGIRTALEEFIAETAATGLVLILVPSRVLAEQWAFRLDRRGVEVQILGSSADALQLRSVGPESGPRGVIVATFGRAQHGQARAALAKFQFSLLLLDGATGGPPESLNAKGLLTAAREVALVTGTSPFDWGGARTLFDVKEKDFDEATSGIILTTLDYEDSRKDLKTLADARQFLASFAELDLGEAASSTGASLHQMLLKVATVTLPGNPPTIQERNEAWRLADQIEAADEVDGRLEALDSLLTDQPRDSKWIISVHRRADVYYLRDHLESERIDAAILTSDVPAPERREILGSGVPVILATGALLAWLGQWPRGYNAVWWSPPQTRADYESRLSLLATAGQVRVFQFRPR